MMAAGRRSVLRLGAGVLGATGAVRIASAQQGVMSATPPPCAVGAGEVVGLVLTGSGAPAGTITVFGQAFRPGDVPRDATLAARSAGGAPLPLQMDVTTRHPDGSVRFAVLALAAPALAAGRQEGAILLRAATAGTPALGWDGLGEVALDLLPHDGGAPWRVDLATLARAAAPGGGRSWQHGPLARQVRIETAVPPNVAGGVTSLRLVADLALRRDGTVWVDTWLRNDAAMRPGGGTAAYTARLLIGGHQALRLPEIRQALYTGLGRAVHRRAGGGPAPEPPAVHPDVAYLADTGAIARYDVANGVEAAFLARLAVEIAKPAWNEPFAPRGFTQYMPTTGGRLDIGPATGWQAAWLISGDARAAAFAMGQAEAGGGIPWHFWDPAGGVGTGGWLDTRRWPGLWTDPRGGAPPRGLFQGVPRDTGWTPDVAHQPDVAFVPYLLTGRRAMLDEVLAQGARAVVTTYPASRRPDPAGQDVIVVNGGQVRGAAWALRQLDEAAWVCPEGDPHAIHLREAAAANWTWLVRQTSRWTAEQGEAHGWLPGAYREPGATAPWQQDMFAAVAAAATGRGSSDARAVLAWQANFLAGRFLAEETALNPADGIAYRLAVMPVERGRPPYTTWVQVGAETRARNWSTRGGWAGANPEYAQLAIASLAAIVDRLGDERAQRTLRLVLAAAPRGTTPADYRRTPTLSIVTRGTTRAGRLARACVAPGGSGR